MQCYRRLNKIKAISFDLDDTLYSNAPIMARANQKMATYFSEFLGDKHTFDMSYWFVYRQQALLLEPSLIHDIGELRHKSYFLGLKTLGFNVEEAKKIAKQALEYFVTIRSDFIVPQSSHLLLADLSKQFPLVAISNGNVDSQAIGINEYFERIYHAGNGLRQKPYRDMFDLTCQHLSLNAENILHVGDCGKADIKGANLAGLQTAWLAKYGVGKSLSLLPNMELTDINELRCLLA